ncbi:hypothetical protein S83_070650 [Arachis hypogaea]
MAVCNGFRVCKHVVWCFLLGMTVADAITIFKSVVPMSMSFINLSSLSLALQERRAFSSYSQDFVSSMISE